MYEYFNNVVLQTECNAQSTQIFNYIQGKKIDDSTFTDIPDPIPDNTSKWYKGAGSGYVDNTNTDYDYLIMLYYKAPNTICINNPIIDCLCVNAIKFDKTGKIIDFGNVPQNVVDKALNSLPFIVGNPSCGTGIWNGCTYNIPNKYLILAGAGLVGLFILEGDD